MEYARAHLDQHGAEDWKEKVDEIAAKIKERNLPPSLRGRNNEAIALMRHLQAQDLYDPVLDGLVSAFKYDKTYFDKIVSSVGSADGETHHREDRRTHFSRLSG